MEYVCSGNIGQYRTKIDECGSSCEAFLSEYRDMLIFVYMHVCTHICMYVGIICVYVLRYIEG